MKKIIFFFCIWGNELWWLKKAHAGKMFLFKVPWDFSWILITFYSLIYSEDLLWGIEETMYVILGTVEERHNLKIRWNGSSKMVKRKKETSLTTGKKVFFVFHFVYMKSYWPVYILLLLEICIYVYYVLLLQLIETVNFIILFGGTWKHVYRTLIVVVGFLLLTD